MKAGGTSRGIVRRSAIAGERRWTGIDDAREIRPRADARKRIAGAAILFVKFLIQHRRRGGQFGARRETHDADLVGIDVPLLGVSAHQANGLQGIVDAVGARLVSVAAKAIPQDDGVHAVVVEERDEVGSLGAHVESSMPAAGRQDDRGARVQTAIDDVDLDRRVVNVDDAVDARRHRLAHVVFLGLTDALHLEKRRAGWIQGNHNTAPQDGLRRVGSVRWLVRARAGREEREAGAIWRRSRQARSGAPGNRARTKKTNSKGKPSGFST